MRRWILPILATLFTLAVVGVSLWGPERLAQYEDRRVLDQISVEKVEENGEEGYRYTLSENEKLYLLSQCLNSQQAAESELNAMARNSESGYDNLTGTYAFVVNRQGPSDQEITGEEVFRACNEQFAALFACGVLPEQVKELLAEDYDAVLYSAIDVLEPRNNLAVWKVSLSISQGNSDRNGRILDAYIDAETGKVYEFYVRIRKDWSSLSPDAVMSAWSDYMGLTEPSVNESVNPLAETTPYFQKYRFEGMDGYYTTVTLGFYEGINEFFLKITK